MPTDLVGSAPLDPSERTSERTYPAASPPASPIPDRVSDPRLLRPIEDAFTTPGFPADLPSGSKEEGSSP
ncbi:MAG: hypothetical protein PHN90_05275 [Methanothrix sp.]|nr:hypothetical protein [Methanothrix sp.]